MLLIFRPAWAGKNTKLNNSDNHEQPKTKGKSGDSFVETDKQLRARREEGGIMLMLRRDLCKEVEQDS